MLLCLPVLPPTHTHAHTFFPLPSPPPRQDPGKVFKGRKMAGRLGGERTTVQNCQVRAAGGRRRVLLPLLSGLNCCRTPCRRSCV